MALQPPTRLASIEDFPNEILYTVFNLVRHAVLSDLENDDTSRSVRWERLREVCRRWDHLIRTAPLLWTDIRWESPTDLGVFSEQLSRSSPLRDIKARLEFCFEPQPGTFLLNRPYAPSAASMDRVGDLTINWTPRNHLRASDFVRFFTSQGVRSLRLFQDHYSRYDRLPTSTIPQGPSANNFRVLGDSSREEDGSVSDDDYDSDEDDLDDSHHGEQAAGSGLHFPALGLPVLPALTKLEFSGVLLSIPPLVSAQLSELTITDMDLYHGSLDQFYQWFSSLVAGCTSLLKLNLDSITILTSEPVQWSAQIPQLQQLFIHDSPHCIAELFKHLDLPMCRELYLRTDLDPEAWEEYAKDDSVDTTVFLDTIDMGLHPELPLGTAAIFNDLGNSQTIAVRGTVISQVLKLSLDGTDVLHKADQPGEEPIKWTIEASCPFEDLGQGAINLAFETAFKEVFVTNWIIEASTLVDVEIHLAPRSKDAISYDLWRDLIKSLNEVRRLVVGWVDVIPAFMKALAALADLDPEKTLDKLEHFGLCLSNPTDFPMAADAIRTRSPRTVTVQFPLMFKGGLSDHQKKNYKATIKKLRWFKESEVYVKEERCKTCPIRLPRRRGELCNSHWLREAEPMQPASRADLPKDYYCTIC